MHFPRLPFHRGAFLLALLALPASAIPAADEIKVDLSSPEATIKTVAAAIQAKDLAVYRQCFTPAALESGEAMLARIERTPEATWTRLQETFRGPQIVQETSRSESFARLKVEAPESPGGGIGTVSLEKIGGAWKIANW